jgi:hypothetical protein
MNEDRYAEYGMVTGVVSVILLVVGFLIVTPMPPDLNAPVDEWSQYYHDHDGAIRAGLVIVTIGLGFFIWFVGSLSSVLRIAAGNPRLPTVAFAGGILLIGALFIIEIASGVATLRPGELSPELTKTLNDVAVMTGLPGVAAAAVFFGAIALVIFETRSGLPLWLGWLSLVTAALQPLALGIVFTDEGAFAGDGVLGLYVPLASALITIVVISVTLTMWARDAARRGDLTFADRVRGGVTGAVTGAAAGARGERPPGT